MPVTERAYESLALEDPKGRWELHDGRPREKPAMTWDHTDALSYLAVLLQTQLDRDEFRVHVAGARLRRSDGNVYIPDVAVVPTDLGRAFRGRSDKLEILDDPLPLVVEVWSPSPGGYDVDAKLPEYERRGDLEIWRLHPYERTLVARRRQPDGTYSETVYRGGIVRPVALPGVTIDLDALFE